MVSTKYVCEHTRHRVCYLTIIVHCSSKTMDDSVIFTPALTLSYPIGCNVRQIPCDRRTHRFYCVLPYAFMIKIRHIKCWFIVP
nr:MAG TPA: hypothetical protein [Caudoviricetes sp.]